MPGGTKLTCASRYSIKRAPERLFRAGRITAAGRHGDFGRVCDLTGRVVPAEVLALATPTRIAR